MLLSLVNEWVDYSTRTLIDCMGVQMRDELIDIITDKLPIVGGWREQFRQAEELADEILEFHNKELEKLANQLGISTAPSDYFGQAKDILENSGKYRRTGSSNARQDN